MVLFTLAILTVADLSAEDSSDQSEPVQKPFVAYAWHGPQQAYGNVIKTFWITRGTTPEEAKAATDTMPEGHRVLMNWNLQGAIHAHPDDRCRDANGDLTEYHGVWWDNGAAETAEIYEDFFRRYHALGGKLDTFVIDHEVNLSNWSFGRNEETYRAIMADPRFDTLAEQLEFRDLLTVANWQRQSGEKRTHYLIWNAVMHERVSAYFNTAFYDPIRKYYPNVNLSNYGDYDGKYPHTCVDHYGHDYHWFSTGEQMHVGTHQSRSLYCVIRHLSDRTLPGGYRPYGASPFAGFRLGVNMMRSMALSSDVPIAPWISHQRFPQSCIWYTDLYQELIFHVGMTGADVFLLWNPNVWGRGRGEPQIDAGLQTKLVSDCLKQLDEFVGAADRRTRVERLAGWYDEFVLTGMNAGGQSVWRFTPKLGFRQRREETLVSQSPAVFRVGPTEVRIPDGKVHQLRAELSGQGFWIVAPIDSAPVVTTDWSPYVTDDDRAIAANTLKQSDRDEDGFLSLEEVREARLAELQRMWPVGDLDDDGRLTSEEVAATHAIRRYDDEVEQRDSDPIWLHALASNVRGRYDANRDMFLDPQEWLRPGTRLTNIGSADDDGNGEISHLELVDWLDGLRFLLPDSLQSLDADDDGQVEKSEFASEWTTERATEFSGLDHNDDGLITADEGSTPMVPRDGRQTYSNDRPRVVVPRSTVNSDMTINEDHVIADLNLRLSISSTNHQLLDIILIGPDGERVKLYAGKLIPWEGAPIFEDVLLDDEAAQIAATLPRPPRHRAFRPQGAGHKDQSSLRTFYGKRTGGTWRLVLATERSDRPALLHSWSLIVTPENRDE